MTKQSDAMIGVLPDLRRYARALTGSQERGDRYVRQFLEVVLSDPTLIEGTDASAYDTGQFALEKATFSAKSLLSMPGTLAMVSSSIFSISGPAPR